MLKDRGGGGGFRFHAQQRVAAGLCNPSLFFKLCRIVFFFFRTGSTRCYQIVELSNVFVCFHVLACIVTIGIIQITKITDM